MVSSVLPGVAELSFTVHLSVPMAGEVRVAPPLASQVTFFARTSAWRTFRLACRMMSPAFFYADKMLATAY